MISGRREINFNVQLFELLVMSPLSSAFHELEVAGRLANEEASLHVAAAHWRQHVRVEGDDRPLAFR